MHVCQLGTACLKTLNIHGQSRQAHHETHASLHLLPHPIDPITWQVIVFSFSKKECETLALNMASLDLNSDEEKKMVTEIYDAALSCLSAVRLQYSLAWYFP